MKRAQRIDGKVRIPLGVATVSDSIVPRPNAEIDDALGTPKAWRQAMSDSNTFEARRAEYALRVLTQMDQAGFVGCFAERAAIRQWAEKEVSMNRERDERDRKQQPGAASGEQTRTFKALIEKLRKPYEDEKKSPFTECPTSSMYHIAQKDCADELAALAPHYVHKDKLRELRDKWLAYSNTAELSRASCWHACATALTALLEQP